jgi:dCMP deaminase
MSKKDWDITFLQTAKLISEHSTCARVQVGAVLVKENKIISIGYNGAPSKSVECNEYFKKMYKDMESSYAKNVMITIENGERYLITQEKFPTYESFIQSTTFMNIHRDFSQNNEIHAEANAIGYAARAGSSTQGSTMYLTCSPCKQCAKLLVSSGIVRVVYAKLYNRSEDDGLPLLEKSNIKNKILKLK